MSSKQSEKVRTFHPRALEKFGEKTCIVALEVARDLRSGTIPPEDFDQGSFHKCYSRCGTACCIVGHIALRMGEEVPDLLDRVGYFGVGYYGSSTRRLFSAARPSDPGLAAEAIDRFVYDGSDDPWDTGLKPWWA